MKTIPDASKHTHYTSSCAFSIAECQMPFYTILAQAKWIASKIWFALTTKRQILFSSEGQNGRSSNTGKKNIRLETWNCCLKLVNLPQILGNTLADMTLTYYWGEDFYVIPGRNINQEVCAAMFDQLMVFTIFFLAPPTFSWLCSSGSWVRSAIKFITGT